MADRAQRVVLPDGTEVWARVSRFDGEGDAYEDGFDNVSVWDTAAARVEGLTELVGGVATSVRDAARHAAPDETSVSFGVEVAAAPGRAVALLADGAVKATLSVTLTWRRDTPNGPEHAARAREGHAADRPGGAPAPRRGDPLAPAEDAR